MQHDTLVSILADGNRPDAGGNAILIIEDNETNALILRAMLRKCGHQASVAADGIEGVACAGRLTPRLILMDLHMPRLDGFAATARIREFDLIPRPAIVAVTANASLDVHAACLTSGFDAVLSKPVRLPALSDLLRKFLPSDTGSSSIE